MRPQGLSVYSFSKAIRYVWLAWVLVSIDQYRAHDTLVVVVG